MIKLSDHLYIEPQARAEAAAREARRTRERDRRTHTRRWAAARVNRLNSDWTTRPYTPNWGLRTDLAVLRARARQMAADAPHFKRFIWMAKQNVIGPKGMALQCRARFESSQRLNVKLNKQVEDKFWEWTFRETCTVSGRLDWVAAQRLFVETLIRDGEVLVQHIAADNDFGYALKFWNVDYLDETYSDELPNGNIIMMSIETDPADRPVAYYLTTPASEIMSTPGRTRQRVRIPAEQMTHAFLVTEDETQRRGVTWFAAALLQGKHLHEYTGNVVEQARVAAAALGFLEKDDEDGAVEFVGETGEDGLDMTVDLSVSPLSMNALPPGYRLNQFDPKQPTQNHTEFKQSMLTDLAAAMGVNYFSLAGDLSAVNYSSARVGLGEERDIWRTLQDFVGTHFCREVYHRWLRSAVITGQLDLSQRQYSELRNPMWRGRGWRYVDPQKEIAGHVTGLENKLESWTEVLAEQGIDINDHLETLAQEQELAARMGVELKTAEKGGPAETQAKEPAEDEGPEDEDE